MFYYRQGAEVLLFEYRFLTLGRFNFNFVVVLDLLRILFLISVSLITAAVLVFRLSYMRGDKYFRRFHLLLMSFVIRMYFLILRPNLVRVLLGWDGLGITSYLLVIYYGNSKAYNSGMVTAITNRLGDAFLLVRIAYLVIYGNWNFIFYSNNLNLLVTWLIMLTATTKSAQIPFSAWLPAAMAAPTPVSSLVHSSTLVTAGVYLLIRHAEFLVINNTNFYLIVIGTLTIIIASLRALFERDLKKIVALSTLRQLGVIILRLGLGAFLARFFHLLRHAFFKALLFLGTGSIIHNRKDYQDMRVIGRRLPRLPLTHGRIFLARLSLIGIPFISAFFSKEIILETILIKNLNSVVYFFIILGILLTALYRTRFIIFAFTRAFNGRRLGFKLDEDARIIQRILILSVPASLGGFFLRNILFSRPLVRSSSAETKIFILGLLFSGIFIRTLLNFMPRKIKWSGSFRRISVLWMLPQVSTSPWLINYYFLSLKIPKVLDRGVISNFSNLHVQSLTPWQFINRPVLSILKILNLFFVWAIVVGLYYLCNVNNIGKNS